MGDIRITEGQYKKFKEEGRITELPKKPRRKKEESPPSVAKKEAPEHPLAKKCNVLLKEFPWKCGVCRLFTLDTRNPVNTAMTVPKDNALIIWYVGQSSYYSPRIQFIGWLWEKEEDLKKRVIELAS